MIDNIRKHIRIKEILDIAVSQLGAGLKLSRCTTHFNLENIFQIDSEFCMDDSKRAKRERLSVTFFLKKLE